MQNECGSAGQSKVLKRQKSTSVFPDCLFSYDSSLIEFNLCVSIILQWYFHQSRHLKVGKVPTCRCKYISSHGRRWLLGKRYSLLIV